MEAILPSLMGAAWLGIAALLVWNVFYSLRRASRQDGNLPFLGMLGRRGLTVVKVEDTVGIAETARAVRRCVFCGGNEACRAEFAGKGQGVAHLEANCPNAGVIERAER